TVTTGSWTAMTGVGTATTSDIRSMAVTRATYTATSKLYIGTSDAKIYRLDNPRDAAAATSPVNITGAAMPTGSVIVSGIAVDPSDDKKVMVTFSNYGVSSIWYTTDASVAIPVWSAVEGTISLPSIRSCAIVTRSAPNPTEYYVGTSVGLFGTTSLSGGTTAWAREGSTSIKYAVVSSLSLRPFDNKFLVGTHGNGMFSTTVVTGVAESSLPTGYALYQNYPNPFNPSTTITFALAQPGQTTLRVFDVLGREVATLVNEMKTGGQHRVEWTPTNLSSGLYYYRLEAGGYVNMKKLLLLK
ncbi:MAG: 5'-Nucleotidase domain protein, partial [Bacteroidetes bacterium]|nr:5'-Nucleotidase domain protein [Bacteroidota bacterium]